MKNDTPPHGRPSPEPSTTTHPLCAQLGAVLRERREAIPLSKYALGARTRVARQTVDDIERAKTAFSFSNAATLCDALGIPLSAVVVEAEARLARASGAARREGKKRPV